MNIEQPTMTRGFRFDLQRAIQAAGVVLRERSPMDRLRLLKILYMASRDALKQTGRPIIGGRLSALENGPLHSEVYDQIKGDANDSEWRKFFRNASHTIAMHSDPGRVDLSPLEIDLLNERAEWAESFETFELSGETHALPEWRKNAPPRGGSKPIMVQDILEAVGIVGDQAASVISDQIAHDRLALLLEARS